MQKCKEKDCGQEAITGSQYCGEHISEKELKSLLSGLGNDENIHNGLKLTYTSLKDFTIKSKTDEPLKLFYTTFRDCFFTDVVFENIIFEGNDINSFTTVSFDNCTFKNCIFEDQDFEDCNFAGVNFINVKLKNSRLNQCSFAYESSFRNCEIYLTKFTGCSLDNIFIRESKLDLADFIYCEFTRGLIEASTYTSVTFSNSRNYNNRYVSVTIHQLIHDYKDASRIRLCSFENCTLEEVDFPKDIEEWNSFDTSIELFYADLVNKIKQSPSVNLLEDLNNIFTNLIELDASAALAHKTDFFQIYHQLYNEVKGGRDYGLFAKLLANFDKSPETIKSNDSLFLPPPNEQLSGDKSELKIVFHFADYNLKQFDFLIKRLRKLEVLTTKNEGNWQILDFKMGSITITLSSSIVVLLAVVYYLYQGVNTYLTIESKRLGNKKLRLEIEEKEAQKARAKEDNLLRELQKEKIELELQELRRSQLLDLNEEFNYDPTTYLPEAQHEEATVIGEEIEEEVETMDLYIRIFEEL